MFLYSLLSPPLRMGREIPVQDEDFEGSVWAISGRGFHRQGRGFCPEKWVKTKVLQKIAPEEEKMASGRRFFGVLPDLVLYDRLKTALVSPLGHVGG